MHRYWFLLSSLLLLVPKFAALAQEGVDQQAVRLPGIVHKWRQPGDDSKLPDITIEEIARCMGSDMNLRSRVAELQRRQTQLEEDVGPIKAQSEVMGLASATIAEEKLALQRAAEIFKREDQELVNRRSRIEKYKSEKIVSVAKLEKVNASIAAYNADVAANNRRREKLIASEKLLNERVEAHNRVVRDANERVAEFSKRNDEFRLDTLRFEQDIARFKAGCSGERELKKLKD
ncbi:MAG: hypothetical protein WCB97_08025 [Thiobacillus sp.]